MKAFRVAVIGAGMGGLASALTLAHAGLDVQLFERAGGPGGKLAAAHVDGVAIDAGPTVVTMKDVFESLFDEAGESLSAHVNLIPARILARHAWERGGVLDLHADRDASAAAIEQFAGPREAQAFLAFTAHAARVLRTLDRAFMRAPRPSPLGLVRNVGFGALGDLWSIQPFVTLWRFAGRYFRDPRLRQLFARYATYCGSSPFAAPATLMLIAQVEQAGVWYVEGGVHRLGAALATLARARGARIRYATGIDRIELTGGRVSGIETDAGERIAVDAVICNADNDALASGLFGAEAAGAVPKRPMAQRSLSAVTWALHARTAGFALAHHSVFFSPDYRAEFDRIFRERRLPEQPTVYVCAQDRIDDAPPAAAGAPERLLCLVNAPPDGDVRDYDPRELDECERGMLDFLTRCGLTIERNAPRVRSSPKDFHRRFPATGGALYGPASHGWMSSFRRPGSRSAIPGLYLAGGSTHPGPGMPMAALSGRLAAASLLADCASMAPCRTAAMSGGTSMR